MLNLNMYITKALYAGAFTKSIKSAHWLSLKNNSTHFSLSPLIMDY